jgi:hypothetical protein
MRAIKHTSSPLSARDLGPAIGVLGLSRGAAEVA